MADEVLDLEVARNKMKEWRDEPPRNSEEVIELGESLIVEHGSKLGDECMSLMPWFEINESHILLLHLQSSLFNFPLLIPVSQCKLCLWE